MNDGHGWRRRRHALIALLVVVVAPVARADAWSLIVNGRSIHFDKPANQQLNDANWGAGLQYDWARPDEPWQPMLTAGGFRDSNDNPSYYAGGGLARRFALVDDWKLHVDAGAVLFVMTRENYRNGYPFVAILPLVSFGTPRVAVNMTYIPKVDTRIVPALFFQLKIGLGSQP